LKLLPHMHPSYRRIAPLILAVLLARPAQAQTVVDPVSLLSDVKYLSSDSLGGRLIGTPGADSAAAYLARRFKQSGLRPAPQGWFQPFTVSPTAPAAVHAGIGGAVGKNVIGVLPGKDPVLRNEIVIVGAHYDHLGPGNFGSLDPDSTGQIHNGADDNASGASALIHIAKKLRQTPPGRTIVFIAFSGEEAGLLGSDYYVKNPIFPLSRTYAMINMDMVGRLRNDRLLVYGVATAKELGWLLDSLNAEARFDLKASGDGWGRSDQSSFYGAGLPVLHLFTDLHEDYHRTTDDWEKINADGLAKVADFTASIVRALGNRREGLTFVNVPPPTLSASSTSSSSGYGAYLGTVPDMSDSPGGVRLTGVRAGSPAEKAGLKGNDIIVQIGETKVPDLQGMTNALRAHKPGDVVEIRILRDGAEQRVQVTLGTRGN
ncbi:MAG TPA: M28 family peptidase, partial [Gemmatimonadales bacterium]|nr:M28 family peptidase [Gemmatimonadales bacterium]